MHLALRPQSGSRPPSHIIELISERASWCQNGWRRRNRGAGTRAGRGQDGKSQVKAACIACPRAVRHQIGTHGEVDVLYTAHRGGCGAGQRANRAGEGQEREAHPCCKLNLQSQEPRMQSCRSRQTHTRSEDACDQFTGRAGP